MTAVLVRRGNLDTGVKGRNMKTLNSQLQAREGTEKELTPVNTFIFNFYLLNLWENKFLPEATQSGTFCYGSPKKASAIFHCFYWGVGYQSCLSFKKVSCIFSCGDLKFSMSFVSNISMKKSLIFLFIPHVFCSGPRICISFVIFRPLSIQILGSLPIPFVLIYKTWFHLY